MSDLPDLGLSDSSNQRFRDTPEDEIEERRREAKAKAEEQRRKDALLTQMFPGWKRVCKEEDDKEVKKAQKTPSSQTRRSMQASVETDTEEGPGTKRGHNCATKTYPIHYKEAILSQPIPEPRKEPLPSLEKRQQGVYSHVPPVQLAREKIATDVLCIQPPKRVLTPKQTSRRNRKSIAVWYGDEVHIVDVDSDGPHRALPPRVRPHRRTF